MAGANYRKWREFFFIPGRCEKTYLNGDCFIDHCRPTQMNVE